MNEGNTEEELFPNLKKSEQEKTDSINCGEKCSQIDIINVTELKQDVKLPGGNDSDSELNAAESLLISESDGEDVSPLRKKCKKKSELGNSEPETKASVGQTPDSMTLKYRTLVDSESEAENEMQTPKKIKVKKVFSSDSELEESHSEIPEGKNKFSSLIDTDSVTDDESNEEQPKVKLTQPKRASAKVAIEQMKAIKSETQRLSRECYISVPYHKPKQHTLKEFLTRKTIVRPNVLKTSKLKMTQEELEEYAKHLEERAKEAFEFFKSDSETENENDATRYDLEALQKTEQISQANNNNGETVTPTIVEKQKDAGHLQESIEGNGAMLENVEILTNLTSDRGNLKKLIVGKELPQAPVIRGDPKMLIDLETGDFVSPKLSGVDNLLQKFLKNSARRKTKTTENLSILSTENNKIEMKNVSVALYKEPETIDHKPGSAYLLLKNNLKKIIIKKRKEELMKRIKENETVTSEGKSFEQDDVTEDDVKDEKEDINELEEEVIEMDENEDFLDNEAEDTDGDFNSDDDADADDEEEGDVDEFNKDNPLPEKRHKSRIISAFEDSDEETEKVTRAIDDILSEPLLTSNNKSLWVDPDPKEPDEENELLELCSGNFGITQKKSVISQMPTTQLTQNINENELLELCSGTFNTEQKVEQNGNEIDIQLTRSKNLNFDTSDEESTTQTLKIKKSRKKKKLGFSDDEDCSDIDTSKDQKEKEEDVEEKANEDNSSDFVEEPDEIYIDYDSEENEIEIKMNRKDRLEKVADFFENEAELSESDWGSADEDEKDLDRYDIELGDEERFDKQKLRSELEKIHLRKMLDDDMREVKKIQEMFFEDEENDGIGRQRQFRWKQSANGFSLDNPEGIDVNGENPGSDDEENEELWRKMRHERELLLKNKGQTVEEKSSADLILSKKMTIVKTKRNDVAVNNGGIDSTFLISKSTPPSARGSFLVRDKDTLKKLATLTKVGLDSDGAASTVQLSSGKVRNFVFAALSETEKMTLKRKSPDTSKNEVNQQNKKQKITEEIGQKKRLIDHLF